MSQPKARSSGTNALVGGSDIHSRSMSTLQAKEHSGTLSPLESRPIRQGMRRRPSVLLIVFFLFILFPFTQIIALPSYNQPYAALLGSVIILTIPRAPFLLPKLDRFMLIYLAVLGGILFLSALPKGLSLRQVSFLLSYVTPLIVTVSCYWMFLNYAETCRRLLIGAICIWIGVGLVQAIIFPDFLTFLASHSDNLGSTVILSGRGVLGLAPEPTHFGFHMLILATTLAILGGSMWAVCLALVGAFILAKSASALLALALGILLWACIRPLRRIWVFLAIAVMISLISSLVLLLDESFRINRILMAVYETGFEIFLRDYSVNARLSGAFAAFYGFLERFGIPLGMSGESWSYVRAELLSDFAWIITLSERGPASGVGLILIQGGFFGLPVVIYIFARLVVSLANSRLGFLASASFVVFLGQFYLATPTFGLVLAATILKSRRFI